MDAASRAKEIFFQSLDYDSQEELWQFIEDECQGDSVLRARVERLLRAQQKAGDFLGGTPELDTTEFETDSVGPIGEIIGNYKLLQKIGEGGFGVVYMAEQERPISRKVAVKVIKPGMDSKEVIARFEAERQALALMDHPNIAKVLDAGTTDSSRLYFVMELVRGIPITEYCDNEHLGTRERLDLFARVCQAIQHAHQKGVIHRDIKPSNVLVTEHDGQPVPKVIDFGVAKAISIKLTEKTVFTRFQQMIGTPTYMSPEQAALGGLDIDTRTDIYSLGVLLYELLTGMTPFDKQRINKAALDEIRRIIREEEPLKPSTKLSTLGNSSAQVARARRADLNRLKNTIRGELDWVVMKALEKERSRRYDTAQGFANDIQRYLDGDAVQACPPSTLYLLRKFANRHRAALTAVAAVFFALLIGVIGTASGWMGEARQKQIATDSRNLAESRLEDNQRLSDELRLRLKQANVLRLSALSQSVGKSVPVQSLLLACEASSLARELDAGTQNVAREALLEAQFSVGGVPILGGWEGEQLVPQVAINSQNACIAGNYLLDLDAPDPARSAIRMHETDELIRTVAISEEWAVTRTHSGLIRLFDLSQLVAPGIKPRFLRGVEGVGDELVALSEDSKWMAFKGIEGHLNLLALDRLNPMLSPIQLSGEPGGITGIAFGQSGDLMATSNKNHTVTLWRLSKESGNWSAEVLRGHTASITGIAFSDDGKLLATVSADDSARLWQLSKGAFSTKCKHVFEEHTGGLTQVGFSGDSKKLFTMTRDTARIWDLHSDDPTSSAVVLPGHEQRTSEAEISSDGRWFVTGAFDNTARVWDLDSPEPESSDIVLQGHEDFITSMAISNDGHWLVTASYDHSPRLWNLQGLDSLRSPVLLSSSDIRESSPGNFLRFSSNGRWLLTEFARSCRLSSVGTYNTRSTHIPANRDATAQAVSYNGRWFVYANPEGDCELCDLEKRQPWADTVILRGVGGSRVHGLAVSSDGNVILAVDAENKLLLWNRPSSSVEFRSADLDLRLDESVMDIGISSDGSHMFTTTAQDAAFWRIDSSPQSNNPSIQLLTSSQGQGAFISPDGNWVVSSQQVLWDLASPNSERVSVGEKFFTFSKRTAFSSDSRHLISGKSIWNLDRSTGSATLSYVLTGHDSSVHSATFSSDVRWAVTGSQDRTARVWDLTAEDVAKSPLVLRGHDDRLFAVAIHPEGRWVATATERGKTIRLWDLDSESALKQAKLSAGRELTEGERIKFKLDEF